MRNVAVLAPSSVRPFELAVYGEMFGLPPFDYAVVSEHPGVPVRMSGDLRLAPTHGLDRLTAADLVLLAPAAEPQQTVSPSVVSALRAAAGRGARMVAVGNAAFALAVAGLLDNRLVAAPADFAAAFPSVRVNTATGYVDDDPVFTASGTAEGIDLCRYLMAKFHVPAAPLNFTFWPTPPARRHDPDVDRVLDWARLNLHEDLSIETLAHRALLSQRSFARRFRAATGISPYAWVLEQRVNLAQRLLETEPWLGVEETAGRAGFSSAALLRQHFQRRFGCSPTHYRSSYAVRTP